MRLILATACALCATLSFAEERSLRLQMQANVLICDTLGQVINTIEGNSLALGCGFTKRILNVEVFREVPYLANDLTFELVRFEFPQRNSQGEHSMYVQYGFIGRPRSAETKSSADISA
jgi:hypothetical protein